MSWFSFALLGYFLYALVTISNKFLLRQPATTKPLVFTFWVSFLSLFTFALAPFGLRWPGWNWLAFDILTGLVFFIALWTFYKALDMNEASRSAPLIGGITPIGVLVLSYFFLGEVLTQWQLAAFIFLVAGGILISLKRGQQGFYECLKGFVPIVLTIIFHAVYSVMLKHLFNHQDFITGFIWSRLGLLVAALAVLVVPFWRREITGSWRGASANLGYLMASSKITAGFASLSISLAVSKGQVSLVNALQGSEYAFLFLAAVLLAQKFPGVLHEKITRAIIAQKFAAIALICVGLVMITW